jgi:hypothetical protein
MTTVAATLELAFLGPLENPAFNLVGMRGRIRDWLGVRRTLGA